MLGLCCGRFVQFLDSKLSLEEGKGLSEVLERLVQTFLQDERYHNDPRYVAHCIRCVGSSVVKNIDISISIDTEISERYQY